MEYLSIIKCIVLNSGVIRRLGGKEGEEVVKGMVVYNKLGIFCCFDYNKFGVRLVGIFGYEWCNWWFKR